jgi:hypothetical protein
VVKLPTRLGWVMASLRLGLGYQTSSPAQHRSRLRPGAGGVHHRQIPHQHEGATLIRPNSQRNLGMDKQELLRRLFP